MASDPRAVVTAYVAAFNRGDLDGLVALFAPDARVWGVLGFGGIDVAKPVWRDLIDCLGMQLSVEDLIVDGDHVAVRYTERGRALRPFRGIPASDRRYEVVAMEWFVVRDGLIHRRWGARDSATITRQLTAAPA